MLLFGDRKFLKTPFVNEDELEQVILSNYEYLFGPSSVYLPKSKITTADGIGTIPDGFVIDIEKKIWYVVEIELISHGVYEHIVKQVTKQLNAAAQAVTKQKIEDLTVVQYDTDRTTKEKFDEANIREINVRKVVSDILKSSPIVGMPIDDINNDLRDYSKTLKNGMKTWIVAKYVELGNPENIIYEFPEEYKPEIDTEETFFESNENTSSSKIALYNIVLMDLVRSGLLSPPELLYMEYKPRKGQGKKKYQATILKDGSLSFHNQIFSAPSNAALAGIQDAGSDRKTVNGWTAWKKEDGRTLAQLRDVFMEEQIELNNS